MQLALSNAYAVAMLGVSALGEGVALIVAGGTARMLYSEADLNRAMSLSLGPVNATNSGYVSLQSLAAPQHDNHSAPGHGFAFQTEGTILRAFVFGGHMTALTSAVLGSTEQPGTSSQVSTNQGPLIGVETFAMLGGANGAFAAVSQWNTAGVKLFKVEDNGALTSTDQITDTAKSYVANISDTETVTLAGQDYLLTLSSVEDGLTCYAVSTDGKATLIDSLGTRDSFSVSGPAALQVIERDGISYAVVASTGSSSLSVVRVNDMGCLFTTDHVVDDRNTRFDHTQVLDSFMAAGRSFVVTAGTDAGLTVMELLPGGQLHCFATGVFETGAGMAAVTGIEAAVNGATVTFYVTDARADGVQSVNMSLRALGGQIDARAGSAIGTNNADLIWGSAARETLQGGGGDDFIFSGGGADVMTGGRGADVFVMAEASDNVRITDFELRTDSIDLSAWGRIYSASALTINPTSSGALIQFNGHNLTLVAGHSLTAASFIDSDFAF